MLTNTNKTEKMWLFSCIQNYKCRYEYEYPKYTCSALPTYRPEYTQRCVLPESIKWFIEDQAFWRPYDSAPRRLPSPLFHLQVVSLSPSLCVSPVELTDGRGEGVGEEPNIRPPKTRCSINQYSLFVLLNHAGMPLPTYTHLNGCNIFKDPSDWLYTFSYIIVIIE